MIRPSAGTARVLGFNNIQVETLPTCAYIMVGNRCSGGCRFCGQSRHSTGGDFLSRISWKPRDSEEVLEATARCHLSGDLQRACFQVVREGDSIDRTISAVKSLKNRSNIPLCVSINRIPDENLHRLMEAGVDRIAVSFDGVNRKIYEEIKEDDYQKQWDFYQKVRKCYPGRVVVHLIIGLGETGREAVESIENFTCLDTPVSLFAFTPVHGTPMASHPPPALSCYRKVQLAYYLIRRGLRRVYDFNKNGEIRFPHNEKEYLMQVVDGSAFQTFGCPGCNRPLYNERPGQVPYNYPRPLNEKEKQQAIESAMP